MLKAACLTYLGTLCKRSLGKSAHFKLRFTQATCYDSNPLTSLDTRARVSALFLLPAHAFDVSFDSVSPSYAVSHVPHAPCVRAGLLRNH